MAEYDMMGNYTGYDDSSYAPVSPYDFEEEERRKEELKRQLEEEQKKQTELASEVSRKEEITEYGDGSRTVKTTREIPAGQRVQPVAPTDYNANIARQESGNRPDIGFHDRNKSSAYGTYGLTNAAYQDARRADPSLPADITQATPEQQTAAQTAFTQQNAKYLENFGIEPTPNNLAAAHFLGAKGLSDYLKTGQISEAAAKANGGVENVKRIVNQRLGGQAAPASGAAQQNLVQGETAGMPTKRPQLQPIAPDQAQPTVEGGNAGQGLRVPGQQTGPAATTTESKPFIDRYQEDQNDPGKLMQLSTDETAPEWMRERSRNRAADIITQQRDMKAAQEKLATATPSDLAKYMREKTTGGSWLKAIFYASIGAKSLAQAEGAKLGIGTEKVIMGPDGKANIVKVSSNGTPLEGYSADSGKKLSAEELVNAMGGAAPGANKWNTTAETYTDKAGNLYQKQNNERGQTRIVNAKTGERYTGDETLKRERDVAGAEADTRKQEFKRENDATAFANSIRKLDYDSKLKAVAEFRQAAINRGEPDLTDAELSRMGVDRPDLGGTRPTTQAAPAQPTVAQAPAQPAQAPQAGPVAPVAPVAPTAQAGARPQGVQPVAPVAPTQPSASGRMSVEEQNRIAAQNKLNREAQSAVDVDEQKRYNEYVEKEIQPKADAAKTISRVRREQVAGPEGILNNPEIAGLLSGSAGGEVGNILRDLITGQFKDQADLSTRVAALNLTPRQKDVLYTQIGLNNQIAPLTLRANAGPGAVSDAEQKANREANVDISRQPLYSGLTLMTRDQFEKDKNIAKNDFRSQNPEIRKTDALNKAWAAQEKRANEAYDSIYAARAAYIAKHNPNNSNPGAVVDAFKYYPVPTWNGTGWDYGTEYAKKAARKPLGSFKQ